MEVVELTITVPEHWGITGRLRWLQPKKNGFSAGFPRLQQEWQSNKGAVEWRDVPTEDA